jgi:peptide deformylase
MKKTILNAPNGVLNNPAKTVRIFDRKLAQLISDLSDTLIAAKKPKGVGLAAPQIGQPWRVFVIRPTQDDAIRVFINPKIMSTSDDSSQSTDMDDKKLEGCLSVPRIWGKVRRHISLVLSYQDSQGQHHKERFEGFPATIIQHETDHVDGILFTQRILEQKGQIFQTTTGSNGREVMEEISI